MHKVNSHGAKTNLWAASAPNELSRETRQLIENEANDLF